MTQIAKRLAKRNGRRVAERISDVDRLEHRRQVERVRAAAAEWAAWCETLHRRYGLRFGVADEDGRVEGVSEDGTITRLNLEV